MEFERYADQVLVLLRERTPIDNLSPRESEVASHYANGKTYSQIAVKLSLAPGTVRKHIQRAYTKLGISTKVDLYKALFERN